MHLLQISEKSANNQRALFFANGNSNECMYDSVVKTTSSARLGGVATSAPTLAPQEGREYLVYPFFLQLLALMGSCDVKKVIQAR